jgi:transposase
MSQKRQYKQYPKAFKEDAVTVVNEQGYSIPEAAKSWGINPNLLYRWKDKVDELAAGTALAEDERAELKRLRKEIKELRMEQAILNKASAFFAQEMQ